ncbi:MAG: SM-20-like protein, partial [Legionella longbeachae]|nr:SM-20-like protein [Legionella longbeachae]
MIDPDLLIRNLCTQRYHIIDGFLESELCQSLRKTANKMYEQGLFRSAKIGLNLELQKNNTIRADEIFWLNGDEIDQAISAFLGQMRHLIQIVNQSLFLGLNEFETHFAIYQ